MVAKHDVMFGSGDSYVAGWLFLPEGAGEDAQVPAVAMAHGLGAVKEMHLEPYARGFAEAGIAALVFDYRYFGASGGEPRQRVHPNEQIEDYRNALTYLSLHSAVDAERLGVWGTSFSGGLVLHLGAHDPRVKAVVSQVPATDINREVRHLLGEDGYEFIRSLVVKERVRKATGGGEEYVTNAGLPGEGFALQNDKESYDFGVDARATIAPRWRNEVTAGSIEAILEFAPVTSIGLISPRPLLMVLAEEDTHAPAPWVREAFAKAGEPKKLVALEGGHYTVYTGPGAEKAAKASTEWFVAHL